MIKTDLGQVQTPFFEQRLDNGLRVIFIPKKSKEKAILLYVSQGTFLHDSEIEYSKMSYGVSYLLEKVLSSVISDKFKDNLVNITSKSDYSFSYYKFDSFEDIFPYFNSFLEIIYNILFTEKIIEETKKKILPDVKLKDYKTIAFKSCLKNLYTGSQIKLDSIPSSLDMVPLHYATLKKFMLKYYIPERMSIIVSGDYKPSEIIENIKKLKFLKNNYPYSKPLILKEDYTKVVKKSGTLNLDTNYSYLSFGLKFLPREELFNRYGQYMFYVYEIIEDLLFKQNKDFLNELYELDSSLLDCKLKEGDEDCFLILTFRSLKVHSLLTFLKNYFSSLDKRVTSSDLTRIKLNYFAKSVKNLSTPSLLVDSFAKAYSNNMPYTGLVTYTSKMDFKSLNLFLKDMSSFPSSYFIIEKA